MNRQPFDGTARSPEPWERGFKDTVIAYPGEITRVKAQFDLPGLYVWHCHIVEHEDNEMMRPYHIGLIPSICRSGRFVAAWHRIWAAHARDRMRTKQARLPSTLQAFHRYVAVHCAQWGVAPP